MGQVESLFEKLRKNRKRALTRGERLLALDDLVTFLVFRKRCKAIKVTRKTK